MAEFDEAEKIKRALKEEEEYFKSYAERALHEWDSNVTFLNNTLMINPCKFRARISNHY